MKSSTVYLAVLAALAASAGVAEVRSNSELMVIGPVESVDAANGSVTVLGQRVLGIGNPHALTVGNTVAVFGSARGDGSIEASEIREQGMYVPGASAVFLSGIVQRSDTAVGRLTQNGGKCDLTPTLAGVLSPKPRQQTVDFRCSTGRAWHRPCEWDRGHGASANGIAGTGAAANGIAGTGYRGLGIAGTGAAATASPALGYRVLGIAGTGAAANGIGGTGYRGLGIAGTGKAANGIAGTGYRGLGIAGTGAAANGIAGTGYRGLGHRRY